jgi:hypothetical protein
MAEKRFLHHIRVLSFWIKRGYDLQSDEKRFLDQYPRFILLTLAQTSIFSKRV